MDMWNPKYKWDFPLAGSGDDIGFNEAGIGMFKSQPYPSLAKEIIQNVLDARGKNIPGNIPVKVKFSRIEINREDVPGAAQLSETIDACYDYQKSGDNKERMMQVKSYSDLHLKADGKIPVLKISDYNTTGLLGVNEPDNQNSCWYGLVKSFSSTNKSDGSSGSQGVGKFATYIFTKLRTVLYSTYTEDGHFGFQGKTILVTFRDKEGRKRVNKARFGEPAEEDVLPIIEKNDVPSVFRRDKPGTDIYILGFEKDEDWLQQMAMSVIEFFFYAIYRGALEVDLEDEEEFIHIGKENIGEKIIEYDDCYRNSDYVDDENFQYTAPLYWKAVTNKSENNYHITDTFSYNKKEMGEYDLYLLMDPDIKERRVLEMRKAGMKIREDKNFRIQPSFLGVFIATGNGAASLNPEDNISSFLRKCENPSHDAWSAANYPEEKKKAKTIIDKIHKLILEAVKSKIPQNSEKEIKAYGLNELLMSQGKEGSPTDIEEAFISTIPEPIEQSLLTANKNTPKDLARPSNGRGPSTRHNLPGDGGKKHKPNNKAGHKKKKVSPISLSTVKTLFDGNEKGYKIVFISENNVSNMHLAINVVGDDGDSEAADIIDAKINNESLNIKEDCVIIPAVKAKQKYVVDIDIRGNRRERLEVNAYGELQ